MYLLRRPTRRPHLQRATRGRRRGRAAPHRALSNLRPSSCDDGRSKRRAQSHLPDDSGPAHATAAAGAQHHESGFRLMTMDLYQTALRYGAAYDELSADGVNPRPHWAHLMESLRTMGPEELGRRWSRAERRIRENGITYNIYSDPLG